MQMVKGAFTLAAKLAKEFMKPNSNKQKIMKKAKDSKVYKEFSEIKSGMMKKKENSPGGGYPLGGNRLQFRKLVNSDTDLAKEEAKKLAKTARKKKRVALKESVGGFNRSRLEKKMGDSEKVNPSAFKKGGAITKRPMGGKVYKNMGGKVTKRPMGGKVYKVDNSGQMMVQRMYGGKLGF